MAHEELCCRGSACLVSQGQSDGDLSKLIKKKSKASAWSHGCRPGSAQKSPIGT